MDQKQRKEVVGLLKSADMASAAANVGKAGLGAAGKALPILGNIWSAGSGINNLAKGNLGTAALDFAGMLPGIGNGIALARGGYEVGKAMAPQQKMATPLVGCDKASLHTRGCAFEAGVEAFCKEAGFDEEDKKAMYQLMLTKQAGGTNPVATGTTTNGGNMAVSDQEMANSRGDPGGGPNQPGQGMLAQLSQWWNTAPKPEEARVRSETGFDGGWKSQIINRTGLGLLYNGARYLTRKGTDEWAAGEQNAEKAKAKLDQDKADEVMRIHNPEAYQSMLIGRQQALQKSLDDKQEATMKTRSMQRAHRLQLRQTDRAYRQSLSGNPTAAGTGFGSGRDMSMPAMPSVPGGKMPTPEAQAQVNPAAPQHGGYFSGSSPDGAIKATTMPAAPAPMAPPSPAPGGSPAPAAAPAPVVSGTAPAVGNTSAAK